MTTHERLPRLFIAFAAVVAGGGLGVLAFTLLRQPPVLSMQLVLVLVALLVSEIYLLRLGSYSVSLAMPLILTALVVAGPGGAVLGAAVSSVSPEDYRERRPVALLAFNFGQLALSSAGAAWAYGLIGGSVLVAGAAQPLNAESTPVSLAAILGAAVVFNSLNILLMSAGVWLGRGVPFLTVFRDLVAPLPTQMALALVGLLMAQVLAIHPVGFPLFLFPLFLARQIYQRYASLRDTYFDMVRSLVGALEAKDPYTRGHSERVAEYAAILARRSGCDDRTTETVEQAALLHDLGKLSLPIALLTKPSKLSEDEFLAVKRHPAAGAGMVERIPALRALAEAIGAHHERIDGSGYPAGLRGDQIPLVARILAVADAYDAMTTHRAYRSAMSHEQAVAELVAGAGTQFDYELVNAFVDLEVGVAPQDSHPLDRPAVDRTLAS